MGHARCDARGVLRGWYESLRNDARLTGWDIEFRAGGDWPGAGSSVSFTYAPVFADLAAWPTGYIDTDLILDEPDAEPQCEHAEVTSDRDLLEFATRFTDRLISIATSARCR